MRDDEESKGEYICTSNVKILPALFPDDAIIDRLVEKVDDRQNEALLLFRQKRPRAD